MLRIRQIRIIPVNKKTFLHENHSKWNLECGKTPATTNTVAPKSSIWLRFWGKPFAPWITRVPFQRRMPPYFSHTFLKHLCLHPIGNPTQSTQFGSNVPTLFSICNRMCFVYNRFWRGYLSFTLVTDPTSWLSWFHDSPTKESFRLQGRILSLLRFVGISKANTRYLGWKSKKTFIHNTQKPKNTNCSPFFQHFEGFLFRLKKTKARALVSTAKPEQSWWKLILPWQAGSTYPAGKRKNGKNLG